MSCDPRSPSIATCSAVVKPFGHLWGMKFAGVEKLTVPPPLQSSKNLQSIATILEIWAVLNRHQKPRSLVIDLDFYL
ncbi:MAG: hypothetical protein ACP5D7_16505 [Limnospira sp.]